MKKIEKEYYAFIRLKRKVQDGLYSKVKLVTPSNYLKVSYTTQITNACEHATCYFLSTSSFISSILFITPSTTLRLLNVN